MYTFVYFVCLPVTVSKAENAAFSKLSALKTSIIWNSMVITGAHHLLSSFVTPQFVRKVYLHASHNKKEFFFSKTAPAGWYL